MEEIIDDDIFQELEQIYGLGLEAKEILRSYIEFVKLKETGQLDDIGDYNVFIRLSTTYKETDKIINFIYHILQYYNVLADDENYYELRQQDIIRGLSKINEKLIVVIDKVNFDMKSTQDILPNFIKHNKNKIFIIAYTPYTDKRVIRINPFEEEIEDIFYWNIKISGQITKEEKQEYINQFFRKYKLKISDKCNLIYELTKQEMLQIDRELMYLAVKSKANNIHTITDKFLLQIHRPQYIPKEKAYGKSAMKELDELIGLEPIKKQIKQIVNYIKVNKKRGQLPMLHMCFLGPSGSGKTEVAKLVARIFKEEHILEGSFVEATRSDLVAGYIGQTALKTKEVINKAIGGVLFFDEGYSLDPKDSGKDYGAEAIAELIKAMEDNRDNLCVILAGYEQPMEDLLKSNSGFSSRIQFKLYFDNYYAEELYLIFKKICKDMKYKLSSNIKPILLEHFKESMKEEGFGNARYCRSLLEKVLMIQAQRVAEDTTADINIIKKCDILDTLTQIQQKPKKVKYKIGFTI